jgi:hypothetical protein
MRLSTVQLIDGVVMWRIWMILVALWSICVLPGKKKTLSLHAHALNVAPLYVLIDRSIALIESVGDWIIGDWIVAT